MFKLSVGEVEKILGISQQRVNQLIKDGTLAAERVGNMWLVDDASVEARLASKPKAGRPAKNEPADERSYTLMNRTHEILSFTFDAANDRFTSAGNIIDNERAPLGLTSPRGASVSLRALSFWWKHRSIPSSRAGLPEKLAELGLGDATELPFRNLGLSLSDQYWIRPDDRTDICWEDINYFDNKFSGDLQENSWLSGVGLDSPDNTSEGELPKRWVCKGKKRLLLKGSTALGQEPYNEIAATELFSRLLPTSDFVPYELDSFGAETVSSCACFLQSDEEYIPAYYIKNLLKQPNHRNDYQHYLECCAALGVDDAQAQLDKMLVCDYLLANADRHWRNFGLIRNVETLEYRVAPVFDTGNSLWYDTPTAQLQREDFNYQSKPFYDDPKRQLRLVDDLGWLDLSALDDFTDYLAELFESSDELAPRATSIAEGVSRNIKHLTYLC